MTPTDVVRVGVEPAATDARSSDRRSRWLGRAPTLVFVAVELFALVLWMAAGRFLWFYLDDWDFIAGRRSSDVGDWFRPHNEHWTTLPLLVYRLLFHVYGLHTYAPYRFAGVVTYLLVAAALFVVMRRARANPWIATLLASHYALYGPGARNIVRPFQMTFNGAVLFGLLHLVLADHDGPFDRRDWIGLAAGFASLMMSGIALPLLVAVAIAVVWRRGWQIAALHTVPPAATYAVWWIAIGRTGSVLQIGVRQPVTVRSVWQFVESGLRGAFSGLGNIAGFGLLLFVLLLAGLALAWLRLRGDERRRVLAVPGALAAGTVAFLLFAALSRASFGEAYARADRYLSITSALLIPALAVALDALVSHRRDLLVAAVVVLALGFEPSVLSNFGPHQHFVADDAYTEKMMLTIPVDPVARTVPRALRPETTFAHPVTVGWLLDALAQHRLPVAPPVVRAQVDSNRFRLSFYQSNAAPPSASCEQIEQPTHVALAHGDVIGLRGYPLYITPNHPSVLKGKPLRFLPGDGGSIAVVRTPGTVVLRPVTASLWPSVCIHRA